MQSLSLRTAILNSRSLNIAGGEVLSLVPSQRERKDSNRVGASIVMPYAIEPLVATQEASRIFFSRVEPGSRAQAVACDSQGAHNKASFARVGRPTKAIHERVDTMLVDKSQHTI